MSDNTRKPETSPAGEQAFLTTKEVAALLRVRERKVYDMAAAGEIPCRKVTGKLLFPKSELDAWLQGEAQPTAASTVAPSRKTAPMVIAGSHDPLLVWALGASGCETPSLFGGSLDGLSRIVKGEAALAGLHLYDAASGEWNVSAVAQAKLADRFVLLHFARRRQGLMFHPDASEPTGVADLKGRKAILRQEGAGGRLLFEALLTAEEIDLTELDTASDEARSETELAEAVADNRADIALGLEAMARRYRLGFKPLLEESFDLLIERRAFFEPPLQRLIRFLHSSAFAERAASYAGYDVSQCGAVRWNGP